MEEKKYNIVSHWSIVTKTDRVSFIQPQKDKSRDSIMLADFFHKDIYAVVKVNMNRISLFSNKIITHKEFFDNFTDIELYRKSNGNCYFYHDYKYSLINIFSYDIDNNKKLFCTGWKDFYISMMIDRQSGEVKLISDRLLPLVEALSKCEEYIKLVNEIEKLKNKLKELTSGK